MLGYSVNCLIIIKVDKSVTKPFFSEHESVPGVVECLKVVTEKKSSRIAKFAFDYATKHNRKKVTAVHKVSKISFK